MSNLGLRGILAIADSLQTRKAADDIHQTRLERIRARMAKVIPLLFWSWCAFAFSEVAGFALELASDPNRVGRVNILGLRFENGNELVRATVFTLIAGYSWFQLLSLIYRAVLRKPRGPTLGNSPHQP